MCVCGFFQKKHINLINGMSCIDGVTETKVQNHNSGRAPKRNSRRSGRKNAELGAGVMALKRCRKKSCEYMKEQGHMWEDSKNGPVMCWPAATGFFKIFRVTM